MFWEYKEGIDVKCEGEVKRVRRWSKGIDWFGMVWYGDGGVGKVVVLMKKFSFIFLESNFLKGKLFDISNVLVFKLDGRCVGVYFYIRF